MVNCLDMVMAPVMLSWDHPAIRHTLLFARIQPAADALLWPLADDHKQSLALGQSKFRLGIAGRCPGWFGGGLGGFRNGDWRIAAPILALDLNLEGRCGKADGIAMGDSRI